MGIKDELRNVAEKALKAKTECDKSEVNIEATNINAMATKPRPNNFSLKEDPSGSQLEYLTFETLTDKSYFGRHLGPSDNHTKLPESIAPLVDMFKRGPSGFKEGRSNLLFAFFAQWFTDGFFRADPNNPAKTHSNHNVDLCQLYGSSPTVTNALRLTSEGKLKSTGRGDNEFLPKLYRPYKYAGKIKYKVDKEFKEIPYMQEASKGSLPSIIRRRHNDELPDKIVKELYATGLERGNLTIGNILFNTLFLREHNSICDALIASKEIDRDDDEKLFQTARNINIVGLIKLTIEEYINHISAGPDYKPLRYFKFDPSFAEKQIWYREPWISAEFNLLYRWHSLIPDTFTALDNIKFDQHHGALESKGVTTIIKAAMSQNSGIIGLQNTPGFLINAEKAMIDYGRKWKLASYNEYREAFKLEKVKSFENLVDPDYKNLIPELKRYYKNSTENLDVTVGWFLEKKAPGSILGELMSVMVAYDAFTQLYVHPLLANTNFNSLHFTEVGMDWINKTQSLDQFIKRNIGESSIDTVVNFDPVELHML